MNKYKPCCSLYENWIINSSTNIYDAAGFEIFEGDIIYLFEQDGIYGDSHMLNVVEFKTGAFGIRGYWSVFTPFLDLLIEEKKDKVYLTNGIVVGNLYQP